MLWLVILLEISVSCSMVNGHSISRCEIAYIKRRSHAIGVGADALIQFAQPAHAAYALEVRKFEGLVENRKTHDEDMMET